MIIYISLFVGVALINYACMGKRLINIGTLYALNFIPLILVHLHVLEWNLDKLPLRETVLIAVIGYIALTAILAISVHMDFSFPTLYVLLAIVMGNVGATRAIYIQIFLFMCWAWALGTYTYGRQDKMNPTVVSIVTLIFGIVSLTTATLVYLILYKI